MITHPKMSAGRWSSFSLSEQMANIGSEVHRARVSNERIQKETDAVRRAQLKQRFRSAMERALELLSYSIDQKYHTGTRKELCRTYEMLASFYEGTDWYGTTLEQAERYFDDFAFAAAARRGR